MNIESIILHDVEGTSRLNGTDEQGNAWTQFKVDYFAEQEDGVCSICDAELSSGWVNLDDSTEVCSEHVQTPGYDKPVW